MKLLRWAAAGASAYAIYKYSIGRKAKGDDVLVTPERAIANLTQDPVSEGLADDKATSTAKRAPARRTPKAK